MVNAFINSIPVWLGRSCTVLQACQAVGTYLPRFCYHDKLFIAGNCRMCLVEVGNSPKPQASCALPFLPLLGVFTKSSFVKKAQEFVSELVLVHHPLDCPVCDQGGECELQEQTLTFGSDRGRFFFFKSTSGNSFWGSLIKSVLRRCILCTRCVRYCLQIGGEALLGTPARGLDSEIGSFKKKILNNENSGGVIELCPVGWSNIESTATSMVFIQEYYSVFIFLGFSLSLSLVIFGASYILGLSEEESEKLSSYECGFDPYEDARNAFDVRFYLVAILFLLFDIETILLFPWAVSLGQLPAIGYWSMIDFIIELIIGFIYAWRMGALDWE